VDCEALTAEILRLAEPRRPDPDALRTLLCSVREQRFAKGRHLARAGDAAEGLWFIRSGLVRYYFLADGVEHTGQFFDDGMFFADGFALTTGGAGLQNIDALADTEALLIPRAALFAAYDADHALERFGRRLIEEAMAGVQRRNAALLQLSAEARYERLVATRPEVVRRMPQYVVASYLGITPEALSRIRRRRTER
jgi:CRP-like cAMP-binding protein